MLEIEQSTTSALLRDAAGEIEQIRNLLDDVYKDAGDGRTIVRELVQNADDAEATRLTFVLVEQGLSSANSLLAGPALLVFNDGPFEASHQEGIRKAIGGSKRADEAKVGRFGLGLKSVFHLAEAFAFLGSDGERLRPGVVNPWAEASGDSARDPLHPDWDRLSDGEARQLASVATSLGAMDEGYLLLWIPLRQPDHLDRYVGGGGIRDRPVEPGSVQGWFDSETALSLLLPQCRHLVEVQFLRPHSVSMLGEAAPALYVRKEARRGRPWRGTDADQSGAEFSCRITTSGGGLIAEAIAIQQLGHTEGTRAQTEREDWPKDDVAVRDGSHRRKRVPRKAIPHGAITLVRRLSDKEPKGDVFLRWSVFLPLDDSVRPSPAALRSSQVLRKQATGDEHPTWDLLLHGYFWPSQDRRSVPGLVNVDGGPGADVAVREGWNLAVGRELVVPLLPRLVAQAVSGLPVADASTRVRAVATLIAGEARKAELQKAMVSETWLLPVLHPDGGVSYAAVPAASETIALWDWENAPRGLREPWHRAWTSRGFVARDERHVAMGGRAVAWPNGLWVELLEDDGGVEWNVPEYLEWFGRLLRREVRRRQSAELDEVRAALVRWFGRSAARGLFEARTVKDDQASERESHRIGVLGVACAVPDLPTVGVPVGAAAAVRNLGSCSELDGVQAVLLPVGAAANDATLKAPNEVAIRSLLLSVGQRLRDERDVTKALRDSWLALAGALVALIPEQSLTEDPELAQLPLLPVTRFPGNDTAALTFAELETARQALRVFSREGEVRDPKQALSELASTLGEPCWMLPDNAEWAEAFRISPISAMVLAEAVLCGDRDLASNDAALTARKQLAKRVLDQPQCELSSPEESARKAARLLLCGKRITPSDAPLYRVPQPANKELEAAARVVLSIVGLERTLIPATLTGGLTADQLDLLGVDALDAPRLRARTKSVLEGQPAPSLAPEQWLSIVRATYEADDESARREWKALPIHRTADGTRTSVTDRTLRSRGEELPAELHDDAILLEPEPEVARYYFDVPKQDAKGVVRLSLATEAPWKHWSLIIDLVASENDDLSVLSSEWAEEVGQPLHERPWLQESTEGPRQDQAPSGLRPAQLALLPDAVAEAARPFVEAGCTGEVRLPDAVAADAWQRCEPLVRGLAAERAQSTPVERLVNALTLAHVDAVNGSSNPAALGIASRDATWLRLDHLRTGMNVLADHAGWALLRAVADACPEWEESSGSAPFRLKSALASALLEARDVRALVAPLAQLEPGKGTPERDLFFGYLRHFQALSSFWTEVLPELKLPTKAGTWALPEKIARSQHGLRPEQLLVRGAWDALGVNDQAPLERTPDAGHAGMRAGERLRALFEGWDGCLPTTAVGSFLALLGNGSDNLVSQVAGEWLKKDGLTTNTARAHLVDGLDKPPLIAQTLVYVQIVKADEATVDVPNLLGRDVHFSLAEGQPSLLAADPQLQSGLIRHWKLLLRAIDPAGLDHTALVDTLGRAAVDIAVRLHKIPRERAKSWWSEHVASSQVAVGPIRRLILDDIPLVLAQLDVRDDRVLTKQLGLIDGLKTQKQLLANSQVKERQSIENRIGKAFRRIEKCLETDDALQRFLLERVRARIGDFRYSPESVLLELFQNADDALVQLQEAKGEEPLPEATRRVEIVVRHGETGPVLEFTHWGRCINDSWSEEFEGRGWDRDLYNMLLMNLSAKPGHDSSGGPSTTGKFGLGFKSVHLVTHRPTVFSGFIRFTVHGGLLPFETEEPWPEAYGAVDGLRPTTIRLPLEVESPAAETGEDGDVAMLVDQIMTRFQAAAPYLPAFSRGVKNVRIRVAGEAFEFGAEFIGILGAAGWSLSDRVQSLGVGTDGTALHGRLLRFQVDAELDRSLDGVLDRAIFGCSLVVAVGDAGVLPLPESVSSLWCLAPTSARWDLGYIVNGPFELDAGRWGIAVDGKQTLHVARRFGAALCDGLERLHDALMAAPADHADLLGKTQPLDLLGQMWRVLAPDPRRREPPTRRFLHLLHGETRGAAGWAEGCGVVPTELPPPFLSHLAAGIERVWVAESSLLADGVVDAVRSSVALMELCQRMPLVSADIFVRLQGRDPHPVDDTYGLQNLLSDWLDERKRKVPADDLDELSGLAALKWPRLESAGSPVEFMTRTGRWSPAHDVLFVARPVEVDDEDFDLPDLEDEVLRAAFAPDIKRMAMGYSVTSERALVAHRLRGSLSFQVADMVSWASSDPFSCAQKVAALRYVVGGTYSREFAQMVKAGDAPPWMRDRAEVLSLTANDWTNPDQQRVVFELFGAPDEWGFGPDDDENDDAQTGDDGAGPPPVLPDEVAAKVLNQLWDLLANESKRRGVNTAHHQRWYPGKWASPGVLGVALRGEGTDEEKHEAWMVLFVLGTAQRLGRTQPMQHRGFIEELQASKLSRGGRTWWDALFGREADAESWFGCLEEWASRRSYGSAAFEHWFTLLPELFAAWRWSEEYAEVLAKLDRRDSLPPDFMATRTDPTQQLGGVDAPALPSFRVSWAVRELLRLRVLRHTGPLGAHCLPRSRKLGVVLELLGRRPTETSWECLVRLIGEERARMHGLYDVALLSSEFQSLLAHASQGFESWTHDHGDWDDEGSGDLGGLSGDPDLLRQDEERRQVAIALLRDELQRLEQRIPKLRAFDRDSTNPNERKSAAARLQEAEGALRRCVARLQHLLQNPPAGASK